MFYELWAICFVFDRASFFFLPFSNFAQHHKKQLPRKCASNSVKFAVQVWSAIKVFLTFALRISISSPFLLILTSHCVSICILKLKWYPYLNITLLIYFDIYLNESLSRSIWYCDKNCGFFFSLFLYEIINSCIFKFTMRII